MRQPPPTASIASHSEGEKMVAPAATRNTQAILDLLTVIAPAHGDVLEIASGTGQHVTAFATALPHLRWHPTEVAADRLASIAAYTADKDNVEPPQLMNACRTGWADNVPPKQLVYLVNLLHLISEAECRVLIYEAARALATGGALMLYGPFKRNGTLTSDGDARFDASLRDADADIGYKDDIDIMRMLRDAGLGAVEVHTMPANNLAFVARSTSE